MRVNMRSQEKEFPFELTVTDPDTGAATVIQGMTKGFTKESTFDAYFDGPSAEIRYNNNRLLYTDISLRAIGGYIERRRRPYGE